MAGTVSGRRPARQRPSRALVEVVGSSDRQDLLEAALTDVEVDAFTAASVDKLLDAFLDEEGRLVPVRYTEDAMLGAAGDEDGARRLERARLRDELRASAFADATMTSYGKQIRAWRSWCADEGVPALPLDPLHVANHLTDFAFAWDAATDDYARDDEGRLVPQVVASTVASRLAALNKLAEFVGLSRPGDNPGVQELMRGIRRTLLTAPEMAKQALDLKLVERCVAAATGLTMVAARQRAAHLLRARANATAGQLARLTWADVIVRDHEVEVTLAKASSNGKPRTVRVQASRDETVCLVTALRDLRAVSPALRHVLTHPDGRPLTRQALFLSLSDQWDALPGLDDRQLARLLGDRCPTTPLMTRRDRALMLTGFYTALRRSNLAALNWGDLEDHGEDGWSVRVRRSKTDQEGKGRTLWVPEAGEDATVSCPATALRAWQAQLSRELGRLPRPDEPVFPSLTGKGTLRLSPKGRLIRLDGESVNRVVQSLVVAAGIARPRKGERNPFGAHSLRAGFVTEALRDDKLTIPEVADVTGHKTVDVLVRYRREVNAQKTNPSRKLLGKLTG